MHSAWEVIFCSSGLHALIGHRLANKLWNQKYRLPARLLAQWVRFLTGIEIHPAAIIGNFFLIDHGMGVVIGETAVIGDYVTLFHGVTLGGTGNEKGTKRHPTVRNGVIIGAGATILGNIELGEGCKVGAGAVVVKTVPPYTTVVGIPAVELINKHQKTDA
jgi:serine O-acetyltransferase